MWMSVLNVVAVGLTVGMFGSDVKLFQEIRYRGNTGETSYVPYILMLGNCMTWLMYGAFKGDMAVIVTNVLGVSLASFYMVTYLSNCPFPIRDELKQRIALVLGGDGLLFFYVFFVAASGQEDILGVVCNGLSIFMFGSQLSQLNRVRELRNTSPLSLPLSVMALLTSSAWVIYGSIEGDVW
eukprot:CAMPEP_0119123400 /NCGR_PEP_ID=MMETSP1310-20130426/3349_1 /TAXON_ID=464262 /ORGANISM="Genus nov. species nov., Strain RCC2339" /LENGTH=181 /DNA_ID=CAMNT_0007113201 /DNA_START=113 /DNA_END=655 /DNA_ORIENTATION=-